MVPSNGSKLGPAELAALEHAFAADPSSNAYRPLAEAYLGMGRFMEAMVVCKKGIKAHPGAPEARVLLARVYADQGKDRKALEELAGALKDAPSDVPALRLTAEIHLRSGEKEAASGYLKQAILAAPDDESLLALAKEHGVELPPPPAPAPVAVPEPAPAAEAPTPVAPPEAPVVAPPAHVEAPAATTAPTVRPAPAAHGPAPTPRPPPPVALSSYAADHEDDETHARSKQGKKGLIGFAVTIGILAVLLGSWTAYTRWQANRDRQISKLLEQTNEFIDRDTYASYKKASETADRILELDSGNYVAHAYLAYIAALRWGEQGEGEDFQRRAEEHLARAKKADETHGRILAAEAYIRFFKGDAKGAQEELAAVLASGRRSALLHATLGTIQMYAGDLDEAAVSLKAAQTLEPNNVRTLAALGQLNRRRGLDAEAWTFYDSALRLDHDHADSLLGKALLVLDANESARPREERETLLAEADQQIARVLGLPAGAISARQLALAKFARAQLLFARNKNGEAETLEQEAFTLDPSNPDIRLMRGRRLLRAGEVDRAVGEIQQAIRIDDKRAIFYVDLSRALLAKKGGAKEAVAALEKARQSFPTSGKILVLLGDAQRGVPNVSAAKASFEAAIQLDGGKNPEARAKIGQLYREAKDYARARESLEQSVKEFVGRGGPGLALALTELGRVFEEGPDRDIKQAFEKYARASELAPTYEPPYFFLGRISAGQKGQGKQARELLETYLKLAPKGEFAEEARGLLAQVRS